jgi:hypothetical protein
MSAQVQTHVMTLHRDAKIFLEVTDVFAEMAFNKMDQIKIVMVNFP